MLALPPDEQQLLSRVSQYLFYRGIIPVVVRSPSEALIQSRNSRFAVIILPDNDPVLIRKVRSVNIIIAQNIIQEIFFNGITSLFCNRLTVLISPVFI